MLAGALLAAPWVQAQQGPFDPAAWPESIDPSKMVHFVTTDGGLAAPSDSWQPTLTILSGGDQGTVPVTIGGFDARKEVGAYLNTADSAYTAWADQDTIDILMELYGDASLFSAAGNPRTFNFLVGSLPELAAPGGGQIPTAAKNQKWNWVLFRIANPIRPSDGNHLVGTVAANAQGDFHVGGVNGGTIRMEGVPSIIVRAVAFGEKGAFGEPEQVNQFAPPDVCDPEPNTNLASIDIAAGVTNSLVVMNNGDQLVTALPAAGPDDDKRAAVAPTGGYLNFAIADHYLGQACNDPRAVKICLDFYDDPALVGVTFGPEAYTTDGKGSISFVDASRRQTLAGTGKWVRRSWTIPSVSLFGVNVTPLTAGPRLAFTGPVAISRYELAVLRVGTHPLAGEDPLADCFEDPNICTDAYGSFAEMDFASGVSNGLGPGSSGGDQVMIQEEAGPDDDRRMAIRPARDDGPAGFAHQYLNFAILNQALGPSSQPNAHIAICVTYYDDPNLIGANFRPEVYQTEKNGVVTFGFTSGNIAVKLQGTGYWREAYFELPDVKFLGVNQGPQAAARFFVSDKVFFSDVKYAVIRPCGPNAGYNALEECKGSKLKIATNPDGTVRISWHATDSAFHLQSSPDLGDNAVWTDVADAPGFDGTELVVNQTATGTLYYRLQK
jgi:hypothetical protein